MNPPKQINRKRLAGLLISWTIYAGLIWWLSYQDTHVSVFGLMLLSSLTSLLCLFLFWRPIRTTTVAVIAGLVLLSTPQQSNAQEEPDPFALECALFLVVVGVGAVIVVGLVRTCNRCLPPTEPPVQPPATNTVSTNVIHHTIPGGSLVMNLKDDGIAYYDVSSMTLSNTDSHGYPFRVWFRGTIQSSTNLSVWKNKVTINGWASVVEVVTVYSIEGVPVSTNWTTLFGGTNTCYVPTLTANEQAEFFRAVPVP